MCLLYKYGKYATLFISIPKTAISSSIEMKQIDKYRNTLKSLFHLTAAKYILSIYIDVPNTCSPSFVRKVLTLSSQYIDSSTTEFTVALSVKNRSVLSVLPDFKFYSVNRIYLRFEQWNIKSSALKLLQTFEQISHTFENLAIELLYDPLTNLQSDKTLLTNLQNCGIKHITLDEMEIESVLQNIKSSASFQLDKEKAYNQYRFLQESLENLEFQQYELCNFSLPEYKCVQNISLWTGKQFIGVGPNAYSRIAHNAKEPFVRQSAICLNSNITSQFKLQKKNLSKCEVLEELLYLGLRTTSGIENSLWTLASGSKSLLESFGDNNEVKNLIYHECLQLTEDAMWLPKNKLVVLNSVLIVLFKCLHNIC